MTSKRKIAHETFELSFKPSIENKASSYKFYRRLKGYSWIGKHFSITSKRLNKTRFYSTCLCLNENLHKLHLNLIENLDKKTREQSKSMELHNVEFKNDKDALSDTLELYVKKYNFNKALSNYLTNYQVQSNFDSSMYYESDLIINGPLVKI